MVTKLYCFPTSTASLLAAFILRECKVPFEPIFLDALKRENKSLEYLAIQPFGQVPCLVEDDGFAIFESRAICRYIVAKYAPDSGLIPNPETDPKGHALFEQAASIEISHFHIPAMYAYFEGLGKDKYNLPRDEAARDKHLDALEVKLEVYDKILSKQRYIAGDKETLADLFHLPYGTRMSLFTRNLMENGKYPNVTRWWREIYPRPAWLAVKDGIRVVS